MKRYGSGFLTMAEYIEREALIEHIKDLPTWWSDGGGVYEGINTKYPDGMFDCEDVVGSIENAPAADVVPVRHGRWQDNGIPESMLCECSACGFTCGAYSFSYCPNCGTKMDGGGENG